MIDESSVKYIIETMAKNPISFLPIVQTIVDSENPDGKKLSKLVAKAIVEKSITNEVLMKIISDNINEAIHSGVKQSISDLIEKESLTFAKDIEESITLIIREKITDLCEKYFETKIKQIDEIFEDYFKSLQGAIKDKINEMKKKTEETVSSEVDKASVDVKIPPNIKDDVIKYIQFLQSTKGAAS